MVYGKEYSNIASFIFDDKRCPMSILDRWQQVLDPSVNKTHKWTVEEKKELLEL